MAKSDRLWVAAMFAANTHFEVLALLTTLCNRDSHERSDTILINADEGIRRN